MNKHLLLIGVAFTLLLGADVAKAGRADTVLASPPAPPSEFCVHLGDEIWGCATCEHDKKAKASVCKVFYMYGGKRYEDFPDSSLP